MAQSVKAGVEELLQLGMVVLPTPEGTKNPGRKGWQLVEYGEIPLTVWDDHRGGAFVHCGSKSGWVVLDVDNAEAEALWRERLGDLFDQVPVSLTGKGQHLWFRLEGDAPPAFNQQNDAEALSLGAKYDFQSDGKGVMVPPSRHYDKDGKPTGKFYRWKRKPKADSPALPAGLVDTARNSVAVPGASRDSRAGGMAGATRPGASDLLARLLENPPRDDSGRNDWLTAVAGHVVKNFRFPDGQLALLRWIDQGLNVPYESTDPGGVEKIWNSVASRDVDMPDHTTGFLVGDGDAILTVAEIGSKEAKSLKLDAWSNFDMRVQGVLVERDQDAQYRIHVNSKFSGEFDTTVMASLFGDGRKLQPWMAGRRLHIYEVPGDQGSKNEGRRLGMYLAAQAMDAPRLQVVDYLGWQDLAGGFVTHDGVITKDGLQSSLWVPDAKISDVEERQHHYGFDRSMDDAISLLAEVLTFHDPTVAAVFGAWWAACLLKPQIMAQTAMFPFMVIEAPSESGKTTGMFPMMHQLGGATRLQSSLTTAAMRDAMSVNRSGIVWADDIDKPHELMELLRQATAEGSRGKKAQDRTKTVTVDLVAPVVLSGEGFEGIHTERALMDRAIVLAVPSPTGRKSKYGKHSQWDDIVRTRAEYGDKLNQVAGHLVQRALQCAGVVDELSSLREGRGRHADKVAILRVGARLLDQMTHGVVLEERTVPELVDAWTGTLRSTEGDYLIHQILPSVWRAAGYPTNGTNAQSVFVDADGVCWFHEESVADVWKGMARGEARSLQLGSLTAIKNQRVNLSPGRGTPKYLSHGRKRMHALSPEASRVVIERSGVDWEDQGKL